MSGGRSRAGYKDRYEARPNASIELIGLPETAWETAQSMATLVKTLVGLPRQVAIVKGLKRYLASRQFCVIWL